jgi:bifunctional DNase/RNase
MVDPLKEMPILVLKDDGDGRILPIWIGQYEANAIALQLEGIRVPRPMTHDLLGHVLESLGATVREVRIRDMRGHTFFADLVLLVQGREVSLDARPSDAVALAVRTGADILVESSLYQRAADREDSGENEDSVHHCLDKLHREEMSEFEM